ncbi:MAG TPA: histidine phosphotransferase family protein [Stellaceae bacterium]|nr:histidine phosphotransferase family protein [Stellaceae bacterium]
MDVAVDLRIVELLSARLCHELVSPTGAIANGVELLGEDDPEFAREAVALIGESARKAGRRLQFYRFAYGTLSGGGTAGPPPRDLIAGFLADGKASCVWSEAALGLPLDWLKLGCNMLVLAAEALPRGGELRVAVPEAGGIAVSASGTINLTAEARSAVAMETPVEALTSRTVQGYFTALLARRLGAVLAATSAGDELVLSAAAG